MIQPLMPKATAVWLIDNTNLTFEQIAAFCQLHILEIQAIANGEVDTKLLGFNPTSTGQLTLEEIERCSADPTARLELKDYELLKPAKRSKNPRYTPITKRGDKPDAIAWLIKQYPDLSDSEIVRLIGTTKTTIQALRNRTHWKKNTLKPRNPVLLGIM